MRKVLYGVVVLLLVAFVGAKVTGAISSHASTNIFQYKGSYIGNNSAVMNVAHQLPQSKSFKTLSLQTKKKPYGMTLNYGDVHGSIKHLVVNNATYMFALIKNAEWIRFVFPNGKYTLTRKQLQQWYGKDLGKITKKKEIKKLIQTNLNNNSKVKQLFN